MHMKKSLYKPNLPAKYTVPIKDYLVPYICVEKKLILVLHIPEMEH